MLVTSVDIHLEFQSPQINFVTHKIHVVLFPKKLT